MKTTSLLGLLAALAAARATMAAPALEAGASYFDFRGARFDPAPRPLVVDEDGTVAPFLAITQPLGEAFALRLSYHYLHNSEAVAQFPTPPGPSPSPLQIIVWGHYRDDVHLVSAAPEFKWALRRNLQLSLAPQLNWVASRGHVAYSTDNPVVLLRAPQRRNDSGFTLGGALRLQWSVGARTAVSLGYQYLDLEPSFDRTAHVYSAGWSWRF